MVCFAFLDFICSKQFKVPTMDIEIQTQVTISCNGAKAVAIPHALLVEHDGCQWLKLRPTHYSINQLFFGRSRANASFSNHPGFQDFITRRNQEWAKAEATTDTMFEDQPAEPQPKKRKTTDESEIVEVPLCGTNIQCLMQGQRPTKGDVVIQLKKDQLEPFFLLLQNQQESLDTRKPYKRGKAAAQEPKQSTVCKTCLLEVKGIAHGADARNGSSSAICLIHAVAMWHLGKPEWHFIFSFFCVEPDWHSIPAIGSKEQPPVKYHS